VTEPSNWSAGRVAWLVLGVVSFVLGMVGLLLPVVPTSPFIILAAISFGRSVPAWRHWLENTRAFGPMIADWHENGSISPINKVFAVAMMAGSVLLGVLLDIPNVALAIQITCLSAAAVFVLTRPNPKPRTC
jgi:uncharacterized protein